MIGARRHRWALTLLALAACGDDGAGPGGGDAPPSASITTAPASGSVGQPVTIGYAAIDDVGLTIVSVGWGTLDAPVEIVPVSGRSATGERSHTYGEAGTYTISVQATDTVGKTGSDSRQIEVSVARAP